MARAVNRGMVFAVGEVAVVGRYLGWEGYAWAVLLWRYSVKEAVLGSWVECGIRAAVFGQGSNNT